MSQHTGLSRLGLLLVVLLGLSAGHAFAGEDEDDAEAAKVRAGLQKNLAFSERGSLIRQLEAELASANEWIQQAVLYVELGSTRDRRAVKIIGGGLEGRNGNVTAFALNVLTRFTKTDLRKGGGPELFDRLLVHARTGTAYQKHKAFAVLRKLVGFDLGTKPGRWIDWRERFPDELKLEPLKPPFDESLYDPEVVAKVKDEPEHDTVAFARIPPVTEYVTKLRKKGLDAVLCLDQTGSMSSVIEATKANLRLMMLTLREVLRDFRVGLVTYDDRVQRTVRATSDIRSLRIKLNKVQAEGGGDFPEGVDKAIRRAFSSRLGWRTHSVKTIVVLGDAPPHQEDVASMMADIEAERAKRNVVVNTVSTSTGYVAHFREIAKAGGGRAIVQRRADDLITEVLILILGEAMRPAMERFVPVLIEIVKAR